LAIFTCLTKAAEIANNGYRDGYSGLRNTEDSFLNYGPQISVDQRKMNAVRAYFEWMPIRYVRILYFTFPAPLLLFLWPCAMYEVDVDMC
jgi:hypothetical protein